MDVNNKASNLHVTILKKDMAECWKQSWADLTLCLHKNKMLLAAPL